MVGKSVQKKMYVTVGIHTKKIYYPVIFRTTGLLDLPTHRKESITWQEFIQIDRLITNFALTNAGDGWVEWRDNLPSGMLVTNFPCGQIYCKDNWLVGFEVVKSTNKAVCPTLPAGVFSD